ncbi:MAG: dihydrolipoyl dehydrogenase family protein, partial [Acidiferrobacter sp.]
YSAVELARVGLTEEQAEDQGLEPAIGFAAFATSPRALGQDEPEGYVRLIADLDSGELLGGEVVGSEAGELIHMLAAAPSKGALRAIASAAFNHPSRTEEFQNAVETLAAKWKLEGYVFGGEGAA